jgi:DNA-directed RNA polymerase specialized sigma subunit
MITDPSAPKSKREKTFVLHKCDNRLCCNPEHFFLGNYSDNQKDAYEKKQRKQPKGELHANAKLSKKQIINIRNRYEKGETQTALAKEFGVSQRTISLIVRYETYV